MKKLLPDIAAFSGQVGLCRSGSRLLQSPVAGAIGKRASGSRRFQSGKLHSHLVAYMAFAMAVLLCVMAAAAVASHDAPLMLGGL